jgi:hypothetical protein
LSYGQIQAGVPWLEEQREEVVSQAGATLATTTTRISEIRFDSPPREDFTPEAFGISSRQLVAPAVVP